MKEKTEWLVPTKDGNYKYIRKIQNSAGTHIEVEEKIPATKRLQKILTEVEYRGLSHDDGSYLISEIDNKLDMDIRKECRIAVETEGER